MVLGVCCFAIEQDMCFVFFGLAWGQGTVDGSVSKTVHNWAGPMNYFWELFRLMGYTYAVRGVVLIGFRSACYWRQYTL